MRDGESTGILHVNRDSSLCIVNKVDTGFRFPYGYQLRGRVVSGAVFVDPDFVAFPLREEKILPGEQRETVVGGLSACGWLGTGQCLCGSSSAHRLGSDLHILNEHVSVILLDAVCDPAANWVYTDVNKIHSQLVWSVQRQFSGLDGFFELVEIASLLLAGRDVVTAQGQMLESVKTFVVCLRREASAAAGIYIRVTTGDQFQGCWVNVAGSKRQPHLFNRCAQVRGLHVSLDFPIDHVHCSCAYGTPSAAMRLDNQTCLVNSGSGIYLSGVPDSGHCLAGCVGFSYPPAAGSCRSLVARRRQIVDSRAASFVKRPVANQS